MICFKSVLDSRVTYHAFERASLRCGCGDAELTDAPPSLRLNYQRDPLVIFSAALMPIEDDDPVVPRD